jgi:hypothetical protein
MREFEGSCSALQPAAADCASSVRFTRRWKKSGGKPPHSKVAASEAPPEKRSAEGMLERNAG